MSKQGSFTFEGEAGGQAMSAAPAKGGGAARGKSRGSAKKAPAKKTTTTAAKSAHKAAKSAHEAAKSARKAAKSTRKAPKSGAATRKPKERTRSDATQMATKQRDISVSEFFAKNRHLLGFDNPAKALLTTVKEGVDNSLDACEEAGILPDIRVEIHQQDETRFRVVIEDNGPGIVKAQVPKIFGRLLYGSKFHRLRQSRGQQGIGISAAGMYGLLTTGKPVKIITRIGKKKPAQLFELVIDTKTNEPKVTREEVVDDWAPEHGTRVEIEMEGGYRGGQHSVDAYVRQISLANPHARLVYLPPNPTKTNGAIEFPRVTDELPPETAEIKPHPYGVELGVLMQMFRDTRARNVKGCLQSDFVRVSAAVAEDICKRAGVKPGKKGPDVSRDEAESIHKAILNTKLMAPPTDCIAPIGEDLLLAALKAEVRADFYASVTRRPTVYRGNPFMIEAAIAYGGDLSGDDSALVYRFANRVPLQYQQGACAVTKAVTGTDWKSYQMMQPRGALPVGPMIIMVHIASVWVPFTSESKEAVAHYPEIIKEMRLALQECGRRVATHIRKQKREADEAKKRAYIEKYIPQVAVGLQEILGFSEKERDKVVTNLTEVLEKSRKL